MIITPLVSKRISLSLSLSFSLSYLRYCMRFLSSMPLRSILAQGLITKLHDCAFCFAHTSHTHRSQSLLSIGILTQTKWTCLLRLLAHGTATKPHHDAQLTRSTILWMRTSAVSALLRHPTTFTPMSSSTRQILCSGPYMAGLYLPHSHPLPQGLGSEGTLSRRAAFHGHRRYLRLVHWPCSERHLHLRPILRGSFSHRGRSSLSC
jgi:hypothetical protein